MVKNISGMNRFFIFIFIFSTVIMLGFVCPLYAGEQTADDGKKAKQAVLSNMSGAKTKDNQQQEFTEYKGLRNSTTGRYPKLQGASFIRLKPKVEDNGVFGLSRIFDVEFMDDELLARKAKKDSGSSTSWKFEQIEDLDKKNSLIQKEAKKDYKTEVSMGLRVSPFSEIYLGKGFLVERKDNFALDPRDDGWRFKFKFLF